MSRYGLRIGDTFLTEYPALSFYGRITSKEILSQNKHTEITSASTSLGDITTRTYRFSIPSDQYVVFRRDVYEGRVYAPFYFSNDPEGFQYEQRVANTLKCTRNGEAFLNCIFEKSSSTMIADTEFYIFKKVSVTDQQKYGVSIFNENGVITYTSSGAPLYVNPEIFMSENAPHIVDAETNGIENYWHNTNQRDIAVLDSHEWLLTNSDSFSVWGTFFIRLGLTVTESGMIAPRLQAISEERPRGFFPETGDPQGDVRATYIDVSKLKNWKTLQI